MLTVTTAAASYALTTAATFKADVGISGTGDDAWIASAIDRASSEIATHCNRVFVRETVAETFRDVWQCRPAGVDPKPLILSRFPVATITSVTVDGSALASEEYECEADTGFLYRLSGDMRASWAGSKVVVAYAAGWISPAQAGAGSPRTLPYDIEAACLSLMKARYFARNRDPLVKSVEVDGVGKEQFWVGGFSEGGMPPDVTSALAPYRLHGFA